jgi:porphobilinogen synthase
VTGFPTVRLRRFRRLPALRSLARESRLSADRFVAPLFVRAGNGLRQEISSLPGVSRLSPDEAVAETQSLRELGIPAVLLFGIPETKDEQGSEAWDEGAAVQETVRRLKRDVPGVAVMTDVCLDEYRRTATAASFGTAKWTTTRRCRCSPARRSRTRARGPTSSLPRT